MPIRTRSGSKYKEWMLEKVTKRYEDDTIYDDNEFHTTLTGMVMRSFERFHTHDACWLNIKCICTNFDLPSPRVQSSTSPDPRIRLLDDLGLTSDLPLQQRPWIADLYTCNTELLYNALPKLTYWPEERNDEDIENEWEELEEIDEMEILEALSPRFSSVDGLPYCRNGCNDEQCECEQCPICTQRVPGWILTLKDQTLKNGQWVGPHCVSCDMEFFFNGTSSRFTPEWHARGFSVSSPTTFINEDNI